MPGDMAPQPAVCASIVIAAYRAQDTIERAMRSACAQTVPVEVIVVDDCSTDGTYAVAQELGRGDPRVRVLRQEKNTGPAAARNRAIAESSAPWIAVLDADDHMAPDRIERLMKEAEADGLDFLADDIYRVTDTNIFATDNRLWSQTDIGQIDLTFAQFVEGNRRQYGQRGEMGFVKPLMRRSFLEGAALAYAPELRLAEDYLLYAEALAAGCRFRLTDPRGYFAVYRSDSLSSHHSTGDLWAIVAADQSLAQNPALSRQDREAVRQHGLETRKEWAWRRLIDAVKARDIRTISTLIVEPPAVVWSLCKKLSEQAWLRGRRRIQGETIAPRNKT